MSKMSAMKGKSKALIARERKELARVERFTTPCHQKALSPEDLKALERVRAIVEDAWVKRMLRVDMFGNPVRAQKNVRATGQEKRVAKAAEAAAALVKKMTKNKKRRVR